MASLTTHPAGWRVRYRLYYPDGSSRVREVCRADRRAAVALKGQADALEALTRQNVLLPDVAIPYVHLRLLRDDDIQRWFPSRIGPLQFDTDALLEAYRAECTLHCTSPRVIREHLRQAGRLLARLGNLATRAEAGLRAWQQQRVGEVSRKAVNIELDHLRQLLDLCVRFSWRDDNPARTVKKLPWKVSRLPQALGIRSRRCYEWRRRPSSGVPAVDSTRSSTALS
jgi:hypothetical protein